MARFRLEWVSLVCLLTGTLINLTVFYKTTDALECHCASGCDSNFNCIGSSNCARGWSGPTCQRYNLALGKDTNQSSTVNDCEWIDDAPKGTACGLKNSSLAVDGIRSTEYWSGTCTHTDVDWRQAWWKVDLGQIHQIYYIKIYFPSKNKNRMECFMVTVDGKHCYTWSPGDSLDPPLSIHCTAPVNGRRVSIRAYQYEFILNLCEVEVYACPNGYYGYNCSEECGHCWGGDTYCNHVDGKCSSGCENNWTGDQCKACRDGYYGYNCSEECGHCRGGKAFCNPIDGNCSSGCVINLTGDKCKECIDGKFGTRCSFSCRCKNPDEVCNKATGHCSSGCSDGFTGTGCQTRCPQGKYGLRCSETCGNCAGGYRQCNHVDGRCKNGCRGNWDGDQCKGCLRGKYGSECNQTCGNCAGGYRQCNHVDGRCKKGCRGNWDGDQCKVCKDLWFGEQCSTECSCKNLDEVCNKTTGECVRSGCQDGRTGVDCQTPCADGTYGYNCSKECRNCLSGDFCGKIEGECPSGCVDGYLPSVCQGNIAKYGTIKVFDFVESTAPLSLYGNPEVTQDGNKSHESCITITGRQPSWKITFNNKLTVYSVSLYVPEGNASKVHVEIGENFCYYGFVNQSHDPCFAPVEGKSVKIYLPGGDHFKNLTICEVYVYADENLEFVSSVPTFSIILAVVGVAVLMVIGIVFAIIRFRKNRQVRGSPKADEVVLAEAEETDDNQGPQQRDPDQLHNEVNEIIYLEPIASDARVQAENSTYSKFQHSISHHYEVMSKRTSISLEARADLPVDGTTPLKCSETVENEYVNDRFQAERSNFKLYSQESDNHHYEVMLKDKNN